MVSNQSISTDAAFWRETKIPSPDTGIVPFHCGSSDCAASTTHRPLVHFPDLVGIDPVDIPVDKFTGILLHVRKDVILPLESFNLFEFGKKDGLQARTSTGDGRNEFSETKDKNKRRETTESQRRFCLFVVSELLVKCTCRGVSRVVDVLGASFCGCSVPSLLASFWIKRFPA
jgi:hypothetical protein